MILSLQIRYIAGFLHSGRYWRLTITDACGKQARKLRYISNAIVVSDAVTRLKRAIRTINESVTVGTDSIYRRLFAFRRLNETVIVTDRLSKQAKKLRYIKEGGINMTDSVLLFTKSQ